MSEQAEPHDRPGQPDAPDVDEVTSAVLSASKLLTAVSVRSLASVADQVTLPQFRLLAVLERHGDTKLVDLADRLEVNPSTAMRMLDRLITAGLADRQSSPGSRRETLLTLTPEGRAVVDAVTVARRREIAGMVERMRPDQRTSLVEALHVFCAAGGGTEKRDDGIEPPAQGW